MSRPFFETRLEAGVLTLNMLPAPAHGVTLEAVECLSHFFTDLATQPEARVLIVQGALDLPLDLPHWQALRQTDPVRLHRALQGMQRWRTLQLRTLPQAVLAVITGPCRGIALPLIEGADLALCTPQATLSQPRDQAAWFSPSVQSALGESTTDFEHSLLHAVSAQGLSGPEAAERGWVTFCVPANELSGQVAELTQSLLDKDPLALQFAKETLAHVPHMDWDTSVHYTAAKFAEIKARQADAAGPSSRASAIAGFLSGQSKPGLKG